MKHSLKAWDCGQSKHRWLVPLCALAMLAWTVQFAAGWYKPHSDIGLSQFKNIELAHTIEYERREPGRTTRPENKPDPVALPGALAATRFTAANLDLSPGYTSSNLKSRTAALPAIRAPPNPFSST